MYKLKALGSKHGFKAPQQPQEKCYVTVDTTVLSIYLNPRLIKCLEKKKKMELLKINDF